MPDYAAIAARFADQPDLYSLLFAAANEGGVELAPLLAACDEAVATRLGSADQGLLQA